MKLCISRLGLVNPNYFMGRAFEILQFVKMAEKVGFPDFPLSITRSQAQQIAAIVVKSDFVYDVDEDVLAESLQSKDMC